MSERTHESELSAAVSAGDVETARALLDAGADVRYVRPHGYTAMVDAMHGRDIAGDDQLLPLLRLLIDRGATPLSSPRCPEPHKFSFAALQARQRVKPCR